MGGPGCSKSRYTVSARPIREPVGSGVSTPFSFFVPSTSSYPFGTRRPFTVVPSVLRSTMKNAPLCASRRMRACSRETSMEASIRTSAG